MISKKYFWRAYKKIRGFTPLRQKNKPGYGINRVRRTAVKRALDINRQSMDRLRNKEGEKSLFTIKVIQNLTCSSDYQFI
ncbi:hypothetical protein [Methanosarcina mazei]|uniref:hypothetical protein n=1 Tax=Methanosarcina mazei TaxID=2209 RepID=UPI000A47C193|nr:hypothetical protein [Methanosarcina mazei]